MDRFNEIFLFVSYGYIWRILPFVSEGTDPANLTIERIFLAYLTPWPYEHTKTYSPFLLLVSDGWITNLSIRLRSADATNLTIGLQWTKWTEPEMF